MFTRKTFEYLEGAGKNRLNPKWFLRNRDLYDESVLAPFTALLSELDALVGDEFPGIAFHRKKICLPLYRDNIPEDGTLVKPFTWAFLAEKRTSRFEWNPGINLYFGEELSVGLGLYRPSSRQMHQLRRRFATNPQSFHAILRSKKLGASWGTLDGERFTRFPTGFDPGGKGADFLWYRQLILRRALTRKEFLSSALPEKIAEDLLAGAPFLRWIRETVGVYEKPTETVS